MNNKFIETKEIGFHKKKLKMEAPKSKTWTRGETWEDWIFAQQIGEAASALAQECQFPGKRRWDETRKRLKRRLYKKGTRTSGPIELNVTKHSKI